MEKTTNEALVIYKKGFIRKLLEKVKAFFKKDRK